MKKFFASKHYKQIKYFVMCLLVILVLSTLGRVFHVNKFLEQTELKTLDLRFELASKNQIPNKDIVILTIDDNSLEILENDLGRWVWNRSIYPQLIDYLEAGKVDSVAFDLMFMGYQKGFEKDDIYMAKHLGKFKNVYVAMNFDNRTNKVPPSLPAGLSANVDNQGAKLDFSGITYPNCRLILKEIIASTNNIGIINFTRDDDGISRRSPLLIKYQEKFYPYLAFKVAQDYIKKHEPLSADKITLTRDNQLLFGKRNIQLDPHGKMIINWYGPAHTFKYISFHKVFKSMQALQRGETPEIPASYFKDKIVFVGVTATSLFDIKSTPLSSIYPGVEVQATVFNNIIDGSSIKKAAPALNLLICLVLSSLTAISVIKLRSSMASSLATLFIATAYIVLASQLLKVNHLWVGIVDQTIVIAITFTFMYIIKYLMKSKDFEYTYKLATTDGLTGLHNHRYFQEHMLNSIARAQRYKNNFSLLLIDIDFFKKFNDTYGHQIGDAVLKQVADILKKTVRTTDLVARYGGEEMAIVLENADIEEAIAIANKVCSAVGTNVFNLSDTLQKNVTISVGISTYPQHGITPAEMIEVADQGLYRAKENGRNQVGSVPEDYVEQSEKHA